MGTRQLEGAAASGGQPPLGRAEAPRPRGLPLPCVRRQRGGAGSVQRALGEIQDPCVRFAAPPCLFGSAACSYAIKPKCDVFPFQTAPDRNPDNIRIEGHVPHEMDINWEVGVFIVADWRVSTSDPPFLFSLSHLLFFLLLPATSDNGRMRSSPHFDVALCTSNLRRGRFLFRRYRF